MAKVEYMTKQLNLKGGGSSVLEAVKLQNDKENVEGRLYNLFPLTSILSIFI